MNISKYQRLSVRTLIDKPDFKINDWQIMITWLVLGLVGEAREVEELCQNGIAINTSLDKMKLADELGDVLWYVAGLFYKFDASIDRLIDVPDPAPWSPDGIVQDACRVAELIKKGIYHQHGLAVLDIIPCLNRIVWYVGGVCEKAGLTIEGVMEQNIKKLQKRYPDGYNSEDSIARVDHA